MVDVAVGGLILLWGDDSVQVQKIEQHMKIKIGSVDAFLLGLFVYLR